MSLLHDAGYQTYLSGKCISGMAASTIREAIERDPQELTSVHGDPAYADVVTELSAELRRLESELGDTECAPAPD